MQKLHTSFIWARQHILTWRRPNPEAAKLTGRDGADGETKQKELVRNRTYSEGASSLTRWNWPRQPRHSWPLQEQSRGDSGGGVGSKESMASSRVFTRQPYARRRTSGSRGRLLLFAIGRRLLRRRADSLFALHQEKVHWSARFRTANRCGSCRHAVVRIYAVF